MCSLIFNAGDKTQCIKYRSFSLLSNFAKVIEKALKCRFYIYIS